MSFHLLKGQNVDEKELAEAQVQDMVKPAVADIKGKNPVQAGRSVRVLKGVRCPYTGGCQSADSRILFEKNTVL
jgi:hypothetical protein